MREIKLSQTGKHAGKYVALVDDEDFEALNEIKWSIMKCPRSLYAVKIIRVNGRTATIRMHQLVLNGKGIDHIDGNGLNNQKYNLRFCTNSENQMNVRKQKNTSSIYKGVCFHKITGKWMAHIRINGKRIHLGLFISEVDAAKAYNAKAIELFCGFAHLNIILSEE